MKFRKHLAGVATAAVAASAFALAAPATAAYAQQPDDPTFTAVHGDLVGVGSDTTQIAIHQVAENGWNAQNPAPAFKIASYAATGAGDIPLPDATTMARPNGSGQGKNALHGGGNKTEVDFARSSGAITDAGGVNEITDGLQQIPFALDTLKMAVSGSTASNAPASLTIAQIADIYKCTKTTWDQVGGVSTAAISPMMPQSGSGTAKFFKAQLDAANGSAVTIGGCVDQTVQEHDDFHVKNNANAIAPFSEGRANLLGGTVHLEDGWSANRAVYTIVRGSSSAAGIGLGDADLAAVFSSNGYLCSPAAKPLIAAGGLKQLLTPEFGGVCGQATQAATTNFAIDSTTTTTSLLAASGSAAGNIDLTATVSPSAAGDVEFFEDGVSLGSAATQGGQAVLHATGRTAGSHSYTASFTHDFGTAFTDSASSEVSGTVKTASTVALGFSAASYGKTTTVTVTTTGIADSETVSVKVGALAAKNATVTGNVATVTVPAATKAGSYSVVATYAGNGTVASSTATKSLAIAKAAPVLSETFPTATLVGKPGKGVVKVAIAGSTVKPTGKVTIKMGTKIVQAAVSLVNGQVTITLPKLTKGKHTLTIVYSGSANVKAGSKTFTITQK